MTFIAALIAAPGGDPGTDRVDHAPPATEAAVGEAAPIRLVVPADTTALSSETHSRLLFRLLESGYAVAGQGQAAGVDLMLQPLGPALTDGWRVEAIGAERFELSVPPGEDASVAELELLHAAIDAVASVPPRAPEPEPEPAEASVPEPEPLPPATDDELPPPAPSRRTPPPPPRAWGSHFAIRGALFGGMVTRFSTTDPTVGASFLLGRERGLSLWLDMQIWPSAPKAPLELTEYLPAAGLRVRPWRRGKWSIDTGALVGVFIHAFTENQFTETSFVGGRNAFLDTSVEVAIGGAYAFWRDFEVTLGLRGGMVPRGYVHRVDGVVVWAAEPWRVSLVGGVNFGKRWPRKERRRRGRR